MTDELMPAINGAWRSQRELSAEQRLDVLNLLNRTETELGREALDESRRRIVVHGWPAEHWLRYRDAGLAQYAMVTGTRPAQVEMCGGGVEGDLLHDLLVEHASLDWWTRDVQGDTIASGRVIRTLQLLQVDLPVECSKVPPGSTLRNFEPGRDEASWLEQNNAAFADHPEQGAWTPSDLDERIHEPWFDPSGFLLLDIDGRLAASCWTKVHELHPDRFGEIYVISVHPDFQGRSLGRFMVTQGLDVLRRKGVSRAVLFVDASNESAKSLYQSIGFNLEREDRLVHFSRR
ncbi:MAG: GNAT family N-acetyltransferase [Acidimicrobiaceae bacterium]|nr:GNAT family N-acetyltransferase [Acidimicrobiaceae bacterium]